MLENVITKQKSGDNGSLIIEQLPCFVFWLFFFFFFFCFLGPHLRHMEVPSLGVESELQLPATATATATAMPDLSCICGLHHSSGQHRILDSLSEAREQTRILMDTSRVCNLLSHMGTP